MSRYARAKDANHNAIVRWAQELGFIARDTSRLGDGFPDSLMGFQLYRSLWVNDLWEIKDGKKGKLTPDEEVFFAEWRGPKAIIRDFDDVVKRRDYWMQIAQALATCGPLHALLTESEPSYAAIQAAQLKGGQN